MTICFFFSFFNASTHLVWGDVASDKANLPSMLRIHLKRSKCDQLGRGVDVLIGRTNSSLCPVEEVLWYANLRRSTPGSFFTFNDGAPLTKAVFVRQVREALTGTGVDAASYAGHSFRIDGSHRSRPQGLGDPSAGEIEQ